jgi:hypothetical protein
MLEGITPEKESLDQFPNKFNQVCNDVNMAFYHVQRSRQPANKDDRPLSQDPNQRGCEVHTDSTTGATTMLPLAIKEFMNDVKTYTNDPRYQQLHSLDAAFQSNAVERVRRMKGGSEMLMTYDLEGNDVSGFIHSHIKYVTAEIEPAQLISLLTRSKLLDRYEYFPIYQSFY